MNIRKFKPVCETAVYLDGNIAKVQHELETELRVEEATRQYVSLAATGEDGFEYWSKMSPEAAEEFGELLAEAARQAQTGGSE